MTIQSMASMAYQSFQLSQNSTYSSLLSADTDKAEKELSVSNLSGALSLPSSTGDLSTYSNLDAYVSGLYTKSQLADSQKVSDIDSTVESSYASVTNPYSYAKLVTTALSKGYDTTSSVNLNGVTTASQSAQVTQLQSLLNTSPTTLVQVYQNYLSDAFPGQVFDTAA